MEQVYFIKELVERKGFSLRKTAKFTGHDFKTVKKYLDKDDWNDPPQKRKKRKTKLDNFKPTIDKWLTEILRLNLNKDIPLNVFMIDFVKNTVSPSLLPIEQ